MSSIYCRSTMFWRYEQKINFFIMCLQSSNCCIFKQHMTVFFRTRKGNNSWWSTSSFWTNSVQWLHLLDRLEPSQYRKSWQDKWEEPDTNSGASRFCDGYIGFPFFTTGWLQWLYSEQWTLWTIVPRCTKWLQMRLCISLYLGAQ